MSLIEMTINKILEIKGIDEVNKHIARRGYENDVVIRKLYIKDKVMNAVVGLKGLQDDISVSCGSVAVTDNGSSVQLGDFSSNVSVIAKLLNERATMPIHVNNEVAKTCLPLLGKLFAK